MKTKENLTGVHRWARSQDRSADFHVCCVAGFQTRLPRAKSTRLEHSDSLPIWKSAIQQVAKERIEKNKGHAELSLHKASEENNTRLRMSIRVS